MTKSSQCLRLALASSLHALRGTDFREVAFMMSFLRSSFISSVMSSFSFEHSSKLYEDFSPLFLQVSVLCWSWNFWGEQEVADFGCEVNELPPQSVSEEVCVMSKEEEEVEYCTFAGTNS